MKDKDLYQNLPVRPFDKSEIFDICTLGDLVFSYHIPRRIVSNLVRRGNLHPFNYSNDGVVDPKPIFWLEECQSVILVNNIIKAYNAHRINNIVNALKDTAR